MDPRQTNRMINIFEQIVTINNNFSELAHSVVALNRTVAYNLSLLHRQRNKNRNSNQQRQQQNVYYVDREESPIQQTEETVTFAEA